VRQTPHVVVVAFAFVWCSARLLASAAPQLDGMMEQMNAKKPTGENRSVPCRDVTITYQTDLDDGVEGPGISFVITNNLDHPIAVAAGYELISTSGNTYEVGVLQPLRSIGTGRLNARRSTQPRGENGFFGSSIAPGAVPERILSVKIGPVWYADLDQKPNAEPNAYITWYRDLPDVVKCAREP